MRTEQFISKSYEEEKNRILQELEDIIPALNAELGIIQTQRKVRVHSSIEIMREKKHHCTLHFSCDGGIYFNLNDSNWNRHRYLISTDGNDQQFKIVIKDDALDVQHLKFLKKLHPKTFPELLRHAGKKLLM
jgi:hypothetical protein